MCTYPDKHHEFAPAIKRMKSVFNRSLFYKDILFSMNIWPMTLSIFLYMYSGKPRCSCARVITYKLWRALISTYSYSQCWTDIRRSQNWVLAAGAHRRTSLIEPWNQTVVQVRLSFKISWQTKTSWSKSLSPPLLTKVVGLFILKWNKYIRYTHRSLLAS